MKTIQHFPPIKLQGKEAEPFLSDDEISRLERIPISGKEGRRNFKFRFSSSSSNTIDNRLTTME